MLDLKAGFQSIPFDSASSYDLTFVTHWGKFQVAQDANGPYLGACLFSVCGQECPTWQLGQATIPCP